MTEGKAKLSSASFQGPVTVKLHEPPLLRSCHGDHGVVAELMLASTSTNKKKEKSDLNFYV